MTDKQGSETGRRTLGEKLDETLRDVDRESVAQADEMARKRASRNIGAPLETGTTDGSGSIFGGDSLQTVPMRVNNRKLKERLDIVEAKLDAILMAMDVEIDQGSDGDD